MEDIVLDRVADILRQRHGRGAARLAADPDDRMVPVDVVQPETGDIADTQGEPGEEQQDGAVPHAHGCRLVAGCDDVLDIFLQQMTGQGREPLPGNCRNRTDKPGPAKTVQRQEAQIRPKRRCLASDQISRCRLKSVPHRIPDQRRAVSVGIVPKMGKQPPHGLVVTLYCPIPDPPITPQPDQETRQIPSWFLARRCRARRGDARADQEIDELPDPGSAVVATGEPASPDEEVRVRTGAVMRKETGQDIVIDLGERDIVQVQPDDEVPAALPVCGNRLVRVSLCHERLEERLHHATAGLDLRRHPHPSRFHEESEKSVQMPSGAFGVLAVTVRTGTGAVMVQELVQDANVERLDPCAVRRQPCDEVPDRPDTPVHPVLGIPYGLQVRPVDLDNARIRFTARFGRCHVCDHGRHADSPVEG